MAAPDVQMCPKTFGYSSPYSSLRIASKLTKLAFIGIWHTAISYCLGIRLAGKMQEADLMVGLFLCKCDQGLSD